MISIRELPRVEALEADARRFQTLDPPTILAFLSVFITAAELGRLVEPHFARFGISQGRFATLMALRRATDQTATPAELSEHLSVTRATVTGLLDALEADGLVERAHRKDDRRSVAVTITKKGTALIEKILPEHYERIGALMGKLNKAEKKQLTALLGKVREGIASQRPSPEG
jgi:DNA-binding MarR family transcriptional regulator